MATGKFTGLQYRPLQGDISNDILNAEDQEFKHREEDRINADRRATIKAAKDKAKKEGLARVKNVNLFDTRSDSLNGTLAETVRLAQQEYPKIFEVLDNSDKYTLAEQTQAQLKLQYLNEGGLVNDLKNMTSSVMNEYQDYETALSSGKIFRDENFEKKFENGYKGVTLSLDDNLKPVALFKNQGEDLDGDGIIDVETMESLNDVYSRPKFQANYDYDTVVKQHSEKLKSAVNQTDNGVTKTKTTGVEADLLNDTVKRFLYNEDGTPTAPMLAFVRQKNMDPNNPEHLDKVESDYKNDIYLRTERGKITDVDGGTALANKKYNDEQGANGLSFVESKQYGNTKEATAHRYSFNTPYVVKGTNKSDRPKTLHEIRYDEQNGKIVLIGKEYKGEVDDAKFESNLNREDFSDAISYTMALEDERKNFKPNKKDDWKEVTITDKAEVTAILSKVMGITSYDAMAEKLKPKRNEEEFDEYGVPIDKPIFD